MKVEDRSSALVKTLMTKIPPYFMFSLIIYNPTTLHAYNYSIVPAQNLIQLFEIQYESEEDLTGSITSHHNMLYTVTNISAIVLELDDDSNYHVNSFTYTHVEQYDPHAPCQRSPSPTPHSQVQQNSAEADSDTEIADKTNDDTTVQTSQHK